MQTLVNGWSDSFVVLVECVTGFGRREAVDHQMSVFKGVSVHSRSFTSAILLLGALCAFSAQAVQTSLIATGVHSDFAYNTSSHTLYISGTDSLLRYDLSSNSFLSPIHLGGTTAGMDISPDGRYLAVANSAVGASTNHVDIVDLTTLSSHRINFNLAFMEGGTFTTAFDGDNGLLVSSRFSGSGWVPLRRVDLATGQTRTLAEVRQNSMLTPSADRSVIAITEANSSNGNWGRYESGANSYKAQGAVGWFTFEIGVSRDGSQVAIPTYGGTYIRDDNATLPRIGQYAGGQPVSAAYNPLADIVYFPWADSSFVMAYDTETGREIERFDFTERFSHTGNWAFGNGRAKVASDGSYLFVSTSNGVRYISLVPEPEAGVLVLVGCLAVAGLSRRRAHKAGVIAC